MTADDIEHLAQVCESEFGQINASGSIKARFGTIEERLSP
jgi:hypothetical protein